MILRRYHRVIAAVCTVAVWLSASQHAHAFVIPPNDGYVTDASGVVPPLLTADQDAQLEAALTEYHRATGNQLAVVLVRALGYEQLEDVSLQIARKYGIGGAEQDNGILLFVSYDDRAVRLEVGHGLEGVVPDIVAKGIIETDITPAFRDGRYYDGIVAAVDSLKKHIGNEYTAERYAQQPSGDGLSAIPFFFLCVVLQWALAIMARTRSWWLGGVFGFFAGFLLAVFYGWWLTIPLLIPLGLFLDFVVSRNYRSRGPTSWWAGGSWGPGGGGRWGGGGGGGGFGGFGGGSFGGGGASGRW